MGERNVKFAVPLACANCQFANWNLELAISNLELTSARSDWVTAHIKIAISDLENANAAMDDVSGMGCLWSGLPPGGKPDQCQRRCATRLLQ
jgi:hypothetical protein